MKTIAEIGDVNTFADRRTSPPLETLSKKDTIAVLEELFGVAPEPTPAMKEAVKRYKAMVISKEEAYAKR